METSPPTQTQPQSTLNDGWRRTTLSVPGKIVVEDIVKDGGPVPPPRKKRLSLVAPEQQPCGFKELFGDNVSRRLSCDSVLNERSVDVDSLQQKRLSDANLKLNANDVVAVPLPLSESETAAAAAAAAAAVPMPEKVHRLQRKISRVGNKKSDKFFGENLSDCLSDEPVTPEPKTTAVPAKDELDQFIDAIISTQGADTNVKVKNLDSPAAAESNDEENKTSLDRKAEFLMAMLDDKNLYKDPAVEGEPEVIAAPRRRLSKSATPPKIENEPIVVAREEKTVETEVKHEVPERKRKSKIFDDTDFYKDMEPVEEPLIVPSRRESKPHICDDEDHLHKLIHHHEHKSEKLEQPKIDKDREVSVADIVEQIITPKKPKRDFAVYEKAVVQSVSTPVQSQHESVIAKPIPRTRHLSQGNLMRPTRPSTTIDLSVTSTAVDAVKHKNAPDSPIQFEKAEIVLKKCISQQSFLTEEMMSQIVDRVYGFKDQIDDLDSYDDGSEKFSPHSKLTTRKISVARKDPATIQENPSEEKPAEALHVEIVSAGPVTVIHTVDSPLPPTVSTTQSTVDFLSFERLNSEVRDISPEQPSTPANSVESMDATIDPTDSIKVIPSVVTTSIETTTIESPAPAYNVLDDIYSSNRSILDGFQRYLDAEKTAPSIATTESSTMSSSDDETTDSESTVKANDNVENLIDIELHNKILKPNDGGERRDSIVEVDQWFIKHNDQSVANGSRRASNDSIGYDTRKVFPFGKSDPGAGTKFFESQSKTNENEYLSTNNDRKAEIDDPVEHSTLLKYLK